MRNQGHPWRAVTLIAVLVWSTAVPVMAAERRRPPEPSRRLEDPNESEETVRERTVGGNYVLEQSLETDWSLDTWLYVFSALMLLCVAWLCFKPTRVYTGKQRKKLTPKKDRASDKKGKKSKS